ncbi:2-oxoglutarate dehydrogenase E1 component [Candidatus Binatia bacterium]|nr:2-oxoglutarate dehydrogenase E1 component [Candidatus Binatia bacterium]
MHNLDFINRANADYVDALYRQYRRDPASVDEQWAIFFAGFDLATDNGARLALPTTAEPNIGVYNLIHSYREFGHLIANLDPLGHNLTDHPLLQPAEFGFGERDLDRVVDCPSFKHCSRAKLRDIIALLRQTYCRTLGADYMEIADKDRREWLQERMEPTLNRPVLALDERRRILAELVAAEGFEQYLHTKYVGQKRFSLEGGEALIPMLSTIIEEAAAAGVEQMVFGMPHRGRLNVLANILRKPYEMIFAEFEGTFLRPDIQGDGDVKYHLGYSRDHTTGSGRRIHLSLCSNPSHLEAVNPVLAGIVRAKQHYLRDVDRSRVVGVVMHGDAAFTGQGLAAETLALTELPAFSNGGTIHIIVNNQIGFTTSPEHYRFTSYPSEFAKIIQAPVFHVNGDDPEAAVQAARLAVGFRHAFKEDVIIDLVCYRKYGHNEGDDPTFTQPTLYKRIARHPGVRQQYTERLIEEGVVAPADAERLQRELRELFDDALNYARDFMPRQQVFAFSGAWEGMQWAGDDWSAQTAVPAATLMAVAEGVRAAPAGFAVHPKATRLLEQRRAMLDGEGRVDWACAEMLALGSLLLEGNAIRFCGQDSGRGTFSQRHAVLRDVNTDAPYIPLNRLRDGQGEIEIIDSMLSEAAVLGFEYGYSSADPRNLVVWEAQFGDFANGAQVIIDQFIASAESKWQRLSGLVMLLPHGYEGQGPEHSSARLERYLQLCAENNLQVCNLTTPAQYFHALRRQMHRRFRKPLVIMSPKSLLRHKLVVSPVRDFSAGTFRPVLGDVDPIDPDRVRRVCLCAGKVFYDLLMARREREIDDVALVRVEQLYPFPDDELLAEVARYPATAELVWVQEEPRNMGAWAHMAQYTRYMFGNRELGYAGRHAAASTASGSYKLHESETEELIHWALRKPYAR